MGGRPLFEFCESLSDLPALLSGKYQLLLHKIVLVSKLAFTFQSNYVRAAHKCCTGIILFATWLCRPPIPFREVSTTGQPRAIRQPDLEAGPVPLRPLRAHEKAAEGQSY